MLIKTITTSFILSLSSALEAFHNHQFIVFIAIYVLHMYMLSLLSRAPTAQQIADVTAPPFKPQLREWAESQRTAYTYF